MLSLAADTKKGANMTKKLDKTNVGVGIAGTGFIGPAHVEALARNGIHILGLG